MLMEVAQGNQNWPGLLSFPPLVLFQREPIFGEPEPMENQTPL